MKFSEVMITLVKCLDPSTSPKITKWNGIHYNEMFAFISMKGLHDFHLLKKENEVAFTLVRWLPSPKWNHWSYQLHVPLLFERENQNNSPLLPENQNLWAFGCMSNLIIGHIKFFKIVCHHFPPRLMVRKDNMGVYYDQYMSFQLPCGLKHLTFARLDMIPLSHW